MLRKRIIQIGQDYRLIFKKNKQRKTIENYKAIRKFLHQEGLSETNDIAVAIGLSASRTRAILKEMPDVEYEGTNTDRKYRLIEK